MAISATIRKLEKILKISKEIISNYAKSKYFKRKNGQENRPFVQFTAKFDNLLKKTSKHLLKMIK